MAQRRRAAHPWNESPGTFCIYVGVRPVLMSLLARYLDIALDTPDPPRGKPPIVTSLQSTDYAVDFRTCSRLLKIENGLVTAGVPIAPTVADVDTDIWPDPRVDQRHRFEDWRLDRHVSCNRRAGGHKRNERDA